MRLTKDKVFADSNILLYLLSDDIAKKTIAKQILKSYPVISTQAISENINVLFKKFQLGSEETEQHKNLLLVYCRVVPLIPSTIDEAFKLRKQYHLNWYDCTILAAALLDDCNVIYSEDMQHLQYINKKLKIINPFLTNK